MYSWFVFSPPGQQIPVNHRRGVWGFCTGLDLTEQFWLPLISQIRRNLDFPRVYRSLRLREKIPIRGFRSRLGMKLWPSLTSEPPHYLEHTPYYYGHDVVVFGFTFLCLGVWAISGCMVWFRINVPFLRRTYLTALRIAVLYGSGLTDESRKSS